MDFNHKQITFAREYRGLSQSELAKRVSGLSQPNLSKYEKGFSSLSDDLVIRIVEYLDFPVSWLNKRISNIAENAHYRKRATLSKKDKTKIEFGNRILGYIVDQFSDSVDWPEFKHIPLDIEKGFTPKDIAKNARKVLSLGNDEPVADIFGLLESKGIVIIEINEHEKFDGVSFITDKGTPVIILNKNFSNDRKRRTAAHEYGHILQHCYFPIPSYRDEKAREKEADEFANEFLMPENEIKNSLRGLRLNDLSQLKNYWLTSMASIIRRAKDLGCISPERYKYFNIELSRGGRRKDEGFDVYVDEPNLFKEAYDIHKKQLGYTDDELGKAFSLPTDVIKHYLNPSPLKLVREY
ncbi:ImmA/IrrE family metallo-endopeptidase [Seonamhaeicola marinus]|uniref:ImmA/IrrE family metallo-endopeptidase n=1 Tax=Seonamhaeicola marinus TaxID=1912246 RepID=A0A5D0HSV1_9FLAO|nr:ImmA/IrrE family metallo-endopeptidase [Seonamhaeicola marinus]TYA74443.1 ImmA/IrrE family metallo-endopeptidase [Seonamhaeicola marinus]